MLCPGRPKLSTRKQLEQWNEAFGGLDEVELSAFGKHPGRGESQNNTAKLTFGPKADEDVKENEETRDDDDDDAGIDEQDELVTIGLFLSPGDVVELYQPGHEPVLAVFVQHVGFLSQFYSVNGRWAMSSQTRIAFAVAGAINPALLQPLVPYLPTTTEGDVRPKSIVQVPRELGAPVQELLSQLTEDAERIYRLNAPVLDSAYSTLADANRTRMMTLSQIAKTLLGNGDPNWSPSPSAMLAVRKALSHNEYRFRVDANSHRLTNVVAIRPKVDVEVVEIVHGWVREYLEHEASLANTVNKERILRKAGAQRIHLFVEKAQRLIAESRQNRDSKHGFVGPYRSHSTEHQPGILTTTVQGEDFTPADRQIISFLQAWVLMDQFAKMPNLHAACASIVQAIGCYDHLQPEVDPSTVTGRPLGQMLLQEMGVMTPYENRTIYDENLMLPTVRLSRNLELLNTKAELTRRNPDFKDAMANLRRDWGSMPVYCIDGLGAQEIDDGISIERVHGKPSEYWLHAHIANPTAFFSKTHVLSGLAAHMTQSFYTPERSFPMLPTWAVQNYFSLDNNRAAITFSTRIDDAGNLLESKISHGVIRNIVRLTPDELATHLDDYQPLETHEILVGASHIEQRPRPLSKVTPGQLQNLRDLYAAARALWKGRKAAGAVRFNRVGASHTSVNVYQKPHVQGLNWMRPSGERVHRVIGDPIIKLVNAQKSVDNSNFAEDMDSSRIVEEMMIAACRTAGSWCAERGIPVMYRGTIDNPASPLSLKEFREQVLLPELEKTGKLTLLTTQKYMTALGRSISHTSPIPHQILGADAYVQVTSPLRRFSDMIAHWQIEAAIRFEARTGQKFDARALPDGTRPVLPFSHRQTQESIIALSPREKVIAKASRASLKFWQIQAFLRAFYYQEAPLPDTFTVRVSRLRADRTWTGMIEGYALPVILTELADAHHHVGDLWEAKISHVDAFRNIIHATSIRLISREIEV